MTLCSGLRQGRVLAGNDVGFGLCEFGRYNRLLLAAGEEQHQQNGAEEGGKGMRGTKASHGVLHTGCVESPRLSRSISKAT